ncbi:hypothetical protein [Sediminicola arcticus]|jgi:hypothetical protein|uniref:DUF4595 domain-containing protein n=1 Tax=Sediminicola arcticus TaxID=1574308 RepID=A0ABV2STC0_9FLAO
MSQNYKSIFLGVLIGFTMLLNAYSLCSQEITIFKYTDFDLKGPVKSCLVVTDYGKEEYQFNQDGLLTQSITRYNYDDYDITLYKYTNGQLKEKRFENYRDGVFDRNTSIANIYSIDTTENKKITEKIISYNKEFLDQYEYFYDKDDQLVKIIRINNDGIDETLVKHINVEGELTSSYFLNTVLLKTIRITETKSKTNTKRKVKLVTDFLDGEPNTAKEEIFNAKDKLIIETNFVYDKKANKLLLKETKTYTYTEAGMLLELRTKIGQGISLKKYIYQFDNTASGNWVKQIVTPDNTYITRKIQYFSPK